MNNNQQDLVKITWENQQMFSHCIPDTLKRTLFQKDMNAIGIVTRDNHGCGAVVSASEKGNIRILSVYVEPEYRRQGLGSRMIKALQEFAAKMGRGDVQLLIDYPFPKMGELELFLLRCGFRTEEEGNRIYYVPIRHLRDLEILKKELPMPEGRIITMKAMTQEQKNRWLHRFGSDFPQDFSPKDIGGTVLEENTFLYMKNEMVEGFAICSRLEDDSVYLAALHSEKTAVKALPSLLKETLGSLLSEYEDNLLCFAAATDSGRKLADHLCRGHEDKIELETIRTSVWRGQAEDGQAEYDPWDDINLVPRLNGLSAVLGDLGISHSIQYPGADVYPAIQADIEGKTVRLVYVLAAPAQEERFVLNLLYEVTERKKTFFELILACQRFNLGSSFVSAILHRDTGQVFIRCTVPEFGKPVDQEILTMAFRLFMDGVRQFQV